MLDHMTGKWWVLALRGGLAVLFGILALAWPGVTVAALIFLFGAYALVDGVFSLIAAFARGQSLTGGDRFWMVLVGIAGIVAGIVAFSWPGETALVLLYVIAFWAIFIGAMQIFAAIRLRREIDNEWWLILGGAAAVLFGIIAIVAPGAGALSLIWLIAIYSIVFGIALLALAFRLRGLARGGAPRTA
jgi:uncharacterized membrane protein HdeD (DUF308 family)